MYDNMCYCGIVFEMNIDEEEVLVKFSHPNGPLSFILMALMGRYLFNPISSYLSNYKNSINLNWENVFFQKAVYVKDRKIEKWKTCITNKNLLTSLSSLSRAYHGVVMLGILIYIVGGFDGRLCFNSVFCFNVESRQWYRRASLHVPRCYVTALACRGLVCALGGFDGDERFRSCERFDPVTRKWEYFSSMNDRRSDASGAVHKGMRFYACFYPSYIILKIR